MSQQAKNSILNKIRQALATPTPAPFPQAEGKANPVQPQEGDLVVEFAEQFSALQGKFIFCTNQQELCANLKVLFQHNEWTKIYCSEAALLPLVPVTDFHQSIESCQASITSCEALIARTGSIVLSSAQQGRLPSVYAPVHVCVAYTSQLVYDIKEGLEGLKEKYKDRFPSLVTLATGPSRTADIEKTLVVGVHGPKEVYCFVVEDSV